MAKRNARQMDASLELLVNAAVATVAAFKVKDNETLMAALRLQMDAVNRHITGRIPAKGEEGYGGA